MSFEMLPLVTLIISSTTAVLLAWIGLKQAIVKRDLDELQARAGPIELDPS